MLSSAAARVFLGPSWSCSPCHGSSLTGTRRVLTRLGRTARDFYQAIPSASPSVRAAGDARRDRRSTACSNAGAHAPSRHARHTARRRPPGAVLADVSNIGSVSDFRQARPCGVSNVIVVMRLAYRRPRSHLWRSDHVRGR